MPDPAKPTEVKLSWKKSRGENDSEDKDAANKVDIYFSSASDSGYTPLAAAQNLPDKSLTIKVEAGAGPAYYRIVPSGKKPVGSTAANVAGTTPSETVGRVVYPLKPGINTWSYYFTNTPKGAYTGKEISTAKDLIDEINAGLSKNELAETFALTVFGYWKNEYGPIGFTFDGKQWKQMHSKAVLPTLASIDLANNQSYQISVKKLNPQSTVQDFKFTLIGRL